MHRRKAQNAVVHPRRGKLLWLNLCVECDTSYITSYTRKKSPTAIPYVMYDNVIM